MEPRKLFEPDLDNQVKPVILQETPEKQLTIITNPRSAENAETSQKTLYNENKDRKYSDKLGPKPMEYPIKLLDENFEFNTSAMEYLTDTSTHYLVVSVLGMQGVGKSMILNLVAQSKPIPNIGQDIVRVLFEDFKSDSERENYYDDDYDDSQNEDQSDTATDDDNDLFKFRVQSFKYIVNNSGCTKGVDMYVTKDRLILLDCQGLWSLADEDFQTNMPSSWNTDPVVGGLQIAAYLMSISHVVITVMDWFTDHVLLRYIHAADMLRPTLSPPITTTSTEDGEVTTTSGENHPHLLLVCNKCVYNQPTPEVMAELQKSFRKTFKESKMQLFSGLHLYKEAYMNVGRPEQLNTQEPGAPKPINLFILPEVRECTYGNTKYYNDYTFEQIAIRFRECVMSASRNPISGVPNLGERGWLHFANKAWETVKNCPFFLEYESFLP